MASNQGGSSSNATCSSRHTSRPRQALVHLPKEILVSSSRHFSAILDSPTYVAGILLHLPTIRARAFIIYVIWLLSGRVLFKKINTTAERAWQRLNLCYAAARILQDSDFQDALIDSYVAMVASHVVIPYVDQLPDHIYQPSHDGSMHRKFAQDVALFGRQRGGDRDEWVGTSTAFLADALLGGYPVLGGALPILTMEKFVEEAGTCKYHDHDAHGRPCYKVRFGLPREA